MKGRLFCGSLPLFASRRGPSPQNFEKRALTIFRLEPDPYEFVHQLICTAIANGKQSAQFLVIKSNNSKLQRQMMVNTASENTPETVKRAAKLPRQTINKHDQ